MNCVFWNTNHQDRCELISELARDCDAGIVVIAEPGGSSNLILASLQELASPEFQEPESVVSRLHVFAKQGLLDPNEVFADIAKRMTIRKLRLGGHELLLVAAHLISKVNAGDEDQSTEIQVLADEIRQIEARERNCRTFLFGDLNMNPFDPGVVKAAGLHATSTRHAASGRSREVQGRSYPFFYNPMWSFFGDRSPGPPGTHYYRRSGQHLSYDWNILDQVLVRPDALPWFSGAVEIVTRIGKVDLFDSEGRPDPSIGSDHFPICFEIAAPREE